MINNSFNRIAFTDKIVLFGFLAVIEIKKILCWLFWYTVYGLVFFVIKKFLPFKCVSVVVLKTPAFSETWELNGLSINIHLSGYVHIFKRTRSSETRKRCSFVREFCFGSFSDSSWSIPSLIFIVNGKHDWQKAMSWTPVLTESHRSACIL